MITVNYDPADGIIRSCSRDFLTRADVRRYYADMRAAMALSRRDWGDVRHLVDATDTPVASAEVMNEFMSAEDMLTGDSDRMAVVVASSLGKMQTNRNLRSEREKAFLSPDAAMTWLMAQPRSKPELRA